MVDYKVNAPPRLEGVYDVEMRLYLLLCAAAAFGAEASRTIVDNDQVRVIEVTVQPHEKTRLHDHKVNRVMIYLQAGRQNLDYQDGKRVVQEWKAGEAKWSPASGLHVAEIISDHPVTIVEVELKKPGDPAKRATGPLDPVKQAPQMYRVVFENDQVRVLHAKIVAPQTTPMHEHALNRVVAYLTDEKIRVTTPDGKTQIVERKAGEVGFSGPATHREENLNSTPFEVIAVELRN